MSAITQPASYITFRLGAELFAIDVVQVREVLDLTEITRVPTAPDYMRGVVNVRGSTVPVVDMRRKFGLAPGPDTVNTRIVVLELGLDGERAVVGGLADSVHDVIELEPAQITDPPRIAMRWRTDVIRGMGKRGEQFIIILDIDKVFAADGGLLVETAQAGLAVEASAP
jgi:purine-binding chemotaxis protein CheW